MTVGSETLYKRLRRKVGASEDVLTNELAEEYFVESFEKYPDDNAKMIAYTTVIALESIRAEAALLGKYAQNQHEEDLTKVFDNLSIMLDDARSELERAADPVESATSFFFGVASGRRGQ